jgi:Synergist-CTERM protein sorting domain-containing protein
MTLTVGYTATSSDEFTITGTEPVNVTKTSGIANITWNNSTKRIDIAAGLPAGTYPVVLTASNGIAPNATHTFTLTVNDDSSEDSRLYFEPSFLSVAKDKTFTVTFKVDSSKSYNQVECILEYSPYFLEFESVTQIPQPPDWMLVNYADNPGSVSFLLIPGFGNLETLSGDTSIATLKFKALRETSDTNISIIQLPGYGTGSSKLQYQVGGIAENISFTTEGCAVTVIDGVATLKASFQGRPDSGDANIEKLTVKWISGNAVIAEETVTTNHNGEADITIPLQNSGLTIWVKGERTLAVSKYVGTVEHGSIIDVGMLRGGDGNGDNKVDLNDFNIFTSNYGRDPNSPGFNRLADFNNDGVVDLNDFNIFTNNYGMSGEPYPGMTLSTMSFINEEEESNSGGGGCNMGFFALALMGAVPFIIRKR